LNTPSFKVYTYVNLESQARITLTAGMMKIAGAKIPPEINFQPSLRQVTLNSCQSSIPIDGLSTALVAPALQKKMFGSTMKNERGGGFDRSGVTSPRERCANQGGCPDGAPSRRAPGSGGTASAGVPRAPKALSSRTAEASGP